MGNRTNEALCGRYGHADRGMNENRRTSQSGMTLIEMTAGIGIFFVLCSGMFSFNYQFDKMRYEFQINLQLTNHMRSVIEEIIWGPRPDTTVERRGVWTANALTINSPTQITYTDTSGVAHGIRQNGQNIEYQRGTNPWITVYDANGASADDPSRYSTSLIFSPTAQPTVVQIRLVLGQKMYGRWYYASMSTNVDYRNS